MSRLHAPPRALFVMDLDGTLIGFDGTLDQNDVAALRRAAAAGVALAIVTGRRRSTFRRERDRLGDLVFRASVSNGSVLLAADNETIERVHEISWTGFITACLSIPAERIKSCIAITLPPECLHGEAEFVGAGLPAIFAFEHPDALILGADGRFRHSVSPWEPEQPGDNETLPHADAVSRRLVNGLIHLADARDADALVDGIRAHYGDAASICVMKPPRSEGAVIDIVARGGKGLAVRDLARSLAVPDSAIAAIGDEMNDMPLLEAAHFRYAVGASPLARNYPGAIEVNTRGAVADAIERFLRELE